MQLAKGFSEEWYKPPVDNKSGAEFLIKPLTPLEKIDVRAHLSSSGQLTAEGYRKGFGYSVKSWRKVTDEGDLVEFDILKMEFLPETIQYQLIAKIFLASSLTDDETKN